jgi:hypothetical protein
MSQGGRSVVEIAQGRGKRTVRCLHRGSESLAPACGIFPKDLTDECVRRMGCARMRPMLPWPVITGGALAASNANRLGES